MFISSGVVDSVVGPAIVHQNSLLPDSEHRRSLSGILYSCVFFLFIILLLPQTHGLNASDENKAVKPVGEVKPLKRDQPVRESLSQGEVHYYQLVFESSQFARVRLDSSGIDLKLSVYNADGQSSDEYFCHSNEPVYISIVSGGAATCKLSVIATNEQQYKPGQYELELEELRPAKANDIDRTAADKACANANSLRALWKIEANRSAIEEYENALLLFSSSADIRAEIATLRKIGDTYLSLNEDPKAIQYYERAYALCKKANNLSEEGDVLNSFAYAYVSRGKNKKALEFANKALRLSQQNRNRKAEALALHTIGDSHYGLGNLQKSLEYYRCALQLYRDSYDYCHQAEVLISSGYAYIELSEIESAFNAYNEALSLSRDSNNRHTEARALRAIGNLQTKLGENQYAIDSFEESLEILQSMEDRLLKATIFAGLGYIHERLCDYQKAIEYFDQAVAIFRSIDDIWGEAEVLMDSGNAYYSLKNYQQALHNYNQALSHFTKLSMPRYVAQTLRNIGLIYDSLGERTRAFGYYNQSLALTRKGQDQRYEAYTLSYMGYSYESMGNKRKAFDYYQRALQLNRISFDRFGESLTLYNLARIEWGDAELDAARARIEAALKIAESLRTDVSIRDLRITYFASVYQYYELYIDILMKMHKERPDRGFQVLAFETAERSRARALVEMLKETKADIRKNVDPVLTARENILQHLIAIKNERRMNISARRNKAEEAALTKDIERITAERNQVQLQIKTANPDYAALMQPVTSSLKEIQQILDNDDLLLEYSLGKEKSYLWAISKTEIYGYELPGRSTIENLADQIREILTSVQRIREESLLQRQERLKESETLYWQKALALSDMLLEPAAAVLETKSLIIIPDGALQYIPFSSLPDPRLPDTEMRPLALNHEIIYEPSVSTLLTLTDRATQRQLAPKAIAIFADPVFEPDDARVGKSKIAADAVADGQKRGTEVYRGLRDAGVLDGLNNIPRLIASRDEAESIMAVIPAGLGLKAVGFDANKQIAESSELSKYRIIHFATHGVFNNEKPELSGLMLSQFDKDGKPQDGFLQLKEIYNLYLPVDMVVLSACNTGLGKYVRGEGLLGLTRGFMYAGAGRVMASLWKVDDEATSELMKNFYRKILEEKKTPTAALRESQIAMWQQKRWRSPYFWAAFVLQGEYKGRIDIPERERHYSPNLLAVLSLVLLTITAYVISRITSRKTGEA